jgi:hypothetical protein
VSTKMATIGIRGCELGFRLRPEREDILVLNLPEGKTVVITRTGEDLRGDLREQLARILNIVESGMAVTIEPGVRLTERRILPSEMKQIVEESTPTATGGGRSRDSSSSGGRGAGSDVTGLRQTVEQTAGAASQGALGAALETAAHTFQSYSTVIASLPTSGPAEAPHSEGPSSDDPGTTVLNGGGPYDHWDWGLWSDGSVEYHANEWDSMFLTDEDFQAIRDGTESYTLTDDGSGQCGAIVHYEGEMRTLDSGYCNLKVQIGDKATPQWGGDFHAENFDGDTLDFSIAYDGGTIGTGGKLDLEDASPKGLSSYSLALAGVPTAFDKSSLTKVDVTGQLIRWKTAPEPPACLINAAVGEFHFAHGTAATVDGGFGANLH